MNRLMGDKKKHYGFFLDMYKCAIEGMNCVWWGLFGKNLSETIVFKLLDEKSEKNKVVFDGGAY